MAAHVLRRLSVWPLVLIWLFPFVIAWASADASDAVSLLPLAVGVAAVLSFSALFDPSRTALYEVHATHQPGFRRTTGVHLVVMWGVHVLAAGLLFALAALLRRQVSTVWLHVLMGLTVVSVVGGLTWLGVSVGRDSRVGAVVGLVAVLVSFVAPAGQGPLADVMLFSQLAAERAPVWVAARVVWLGVALGLFALGTRLYLNTNTMLSGDVGRGRVRAARPSHRRGLGAMLAQPLAEAARTDEAIATLVHTFRWPAAVQAEIAYRTVITLVRGHILMALAFVPLLVLLGSVRSLPRGWSPDAMVTGVVGGFGFLSLMALLFVFFVLLGDVHAQVCQSAAHPVVLTSTRHSDITVGTFVGLLASQWLVGLALLAVFLVGLNLRLLLLVSLGLGATFVLLVPATMMISALALVLALLLRERMSLAVRGVLVVMLMITMVLTLAEPRLGWLFPVGFAPYLLIGQWLNQTLGLVVRGGTTVTAATTAGVVLAGVVQSLLLLVWASRLERRNEA